MHELSIATAIVDTASRHAQGRQVCVVSVRVGALRQVSAASLRFCFEVVARDSDCAHARLELTEVALRLRCRDCGEEWQSEEPEFRCPRCVPGSVDVLGGEELEVDYIEVEEESECIAPW
jgi:hydrogenase nickel incorporation protein HypA/HybF